MGLPCSPKVNWIRSLSRCSVQWKGLKRIVKEWHPNLFAVGKICNNCPSAHLPSIPPLLAHNFSLGLSALLGSTDNWHFLSTHPQFPHRVPVRRKMSKTGSPGTTHRIHFLLLCLEFKITNHPVYAVIMMVSLQSFHQFRWPFLCCSRTRFCSFI